MVTPNLPTDNNFDMSAWPELNNRSWPQTSGRHYEIALAVQNKNIDTNLGRTAIRPFPPLGPFIYLFALLSRALIQTQFNVALVRDTHKSTESTTAMVRY